MTNSLTFPPERTAALARLAGFLPRAGQDYARLRNLDLPGHRQVSGLSPYLRHRLIREDEVLAAIAPLGPAAAKFRAEVLWRTYWKGWLELRPGIWSAYRQGVQAALNRVQTSSGLRAEWEAACKGDTGIDAFDHWARELAATGYLHNHARMWFASIWIFTLRLPWELGADFFLRHLLDGDPASNTLSWRWVAGLHTPGKTYLATADNIARYTEGRFRPAGLATRADPLPMVPHPAPGPVPAGDDLGPSNAPWALLLHEDDLDPGAVPFPIPPVAAAVLIAPERRSPLATAPQVVRFTAGAAADALARLPPGAGPVTGPVSGPDAAGTLLRWAVDTGVTTILTPYAPTGPVAEVLATLRQTLAPHGIRLSRTLRPYDARLWPHATRSFFSFHEAALPLISP